MLIPSNPPRFSPVPSYADVITQFNAMMEQLLSVASLPANIAPIAAPAVFTGGDAFKFPRSCDSATFPDGRPAPDVDLMRLITFQQALAQRHPNIVVRSRLWVRAVPAQGLTYVVLLAHAVMRSSGSRGAQLLINPLRKVFGVYDIEDLIKDYLANIGIPPQCFTGEDSTNAIERFGVV